MSTETPLTLKANPFKPGFGFQPPVLAGREAERTKLLTGLAQLQDGEPPASILISAPRGMGKTVLLNWLTQQVDNSQCGRLVKVSADQVETLRDLVGLLAPKLLDSTSFTQSGKVNIGVVGGGVSQTTTPTPAALGAALQEKLLNEHHSQPLIITVDEAHTLAPDVARRLANLTQNLIGESCPVWLLLAGTPGLISHLMSAGVGATFVERTKKMLPRLLSQEASREALAAPLLARDWQVDEMALQSVLQDAQGYPYFLQLWGEAVWNAGVSQGRRCLDEAMVTTAGEEVNATRAGFYGGRYRELENRAPESVGPARTLRAAVAVSRVWLDGGETPLTHWQLDRCLADSGLDPDSRDLVNLKALFEHSGFLVDQGGGQWAPGIPSLAYYVYDQAHTDIAPAPTTGDAPTRIPSA